MNSFRTIHQHEKLDKIVFNKNNNNMPTMNVQLSRPRSAEAENDPLAKVD
eukprot:GDKH01001025.1.p1 GENE.GDKH01001025.1~~GDKH01001025.1.p1  ORF type:complete len:50 (-),score=3.60 GDKH01001025.1:228-377(-)